MQASELFSPAPDFPLADKLDGIAQPWTWLAAMRQFFDQQDWDSVMPRDDVPPGLHITGSVYIHPSVDLPAYGEIQVPCWINEGSVLRPGIYIRGYVYAGRNCVLGHACEFKNALLLDHVQVPHFNYVGDAVLGNHSHLGAGVILANLRFNQATVKVRTDDGKIDTGLKKLSALLGDNAEAGCNAVLQPGTVLGRYAIVGSGTVYSGTLPAHTLVTQFSGDYQYHSLKD